MLYNELISGLPKSSLLAFGCASIMGRVGRHQSAIAVNNALEAGITHFDIARSYGYGEAESCVGTLLKRNRHRVVIASKFGITPSKSSYMLKCLKPLARMGRTILPKKIYKKTASAYGINPVAEKFVIKNITGGLETTLNNLQTDFLDIFFLHECHHGSITEELHGFLNSLIQAGKIRAYGFATSINSIISISSNYDGNYILQFHNSLLEPNKLKLMANNRCPIITHSPFYNLNYVYSFYEKNKNQLKEVDLQCLSKKDIVEIMLLYAIQNNKTGSVITSMLSGDHLAANIRVLEKPNFSTHQVEAFRKYLLEINL